MLIPLQLPKTLKLAKQEDLPNDFSPSIFDEIKNANIVEGFKLHHKDDNPENINLPFNFFSEINVDNSRLWDLIILLTEDMPEEISLIFGHIDTEPIYGKYGNQEYLLNFLENYTKELTQDTFIYFGFIYQDKAKLIELFVDECKYIKYWGIDEISFRNKLAEFNIKEVDDLNFVDEFPKVRESLSYLEKDATSSEELIQILKTEFL